MRMLRHCTNCDGWFEVTKDKNDREINWRYIGVVAQCSDGCCGTDLYLCPGCEMAVTDEAEEIAICPDESAHYHVCPQPHSYGTGLMCVFCGYITVLDTERDSSPQQLLDEHICPARQAILSELQTQRSIHEARK